LRLEADPTLAQSLESLRRSERPLTAREIARAIPRSSRPDPGAIEELLRHDGRAVQWPPKTASAPPRYWMRRPREVAAAALIEAVANAALSASDLQKKLARHAARFSAAQRRELVESLLPALAAEKKVFVHPAPGKGKPAYGSRPPEAARYVGKLRKELEALAASLASAGITREQLLDALRASPASAPAAAPLAARVTEYLKSRPGGIGVGQLRDELGVGKAEFDQAVLDLYRQQRVYLDRHDWPMGLSQEARDQLVSDGAGNYYVVIGLQDADAESIP